MQTASETMTDDRPIILFDGVCNLCNASVGFIVDRDPKGVFRLGALQSDRAAPYLKDHGIQPDDMESLVLIENGQVYRRSTAALRIARKLSGGWPLLYVFILAPPFLRDAVYRWIARNRYRWFGKTESCQVTTSDLEERFL